MNILRFCKCFFKFHFILNITKYVSTCIKVEVLLYQRSFNLQKNRQLIPCWHETQPSGCTRPGCPFKHSKHDPVNQYGYKETLSGR